MSPKRHSASASRTVEAHNEQVRRGLVETLVARQRLRISDAEDIAQEAVLQACSTETVVRHPRAWLVRVALNVLGQKRRRNAIRCPDALGGVPLDDAPWFSADAHQEHALLLKQLVLSLPPPLQEVFVLSRFEGLTNAEIATRCGIAEKTVEWRMTKALAHLAAKLRD